MSRHTSFRIVRPSSANPRHIAERDPFKLERRRGQRKTAEGVLRISYRVPGTEASGARFGITQLTLLDRSPGGLGATTPVELPTGMAVKICPEGSSVAWLSARVVRCESTGDGFRVGLQLGFPAAA